MTRRLPVVQWRRSGECNRCGECCTGGGDPFAGERGTPAVGGACALYAVGADGLGVCTDRTDHYYLHGCALWPSKPAHIQAYPSCSYRFEQVT